MVFSSYIFLFIFLPIFFIIYFSLPKKTQFIVLALLSYLFYGWANPLFVFLMLFSTTVDYFCGLKISQFKFGQKEKIKILKKEVERSRTQKTALIVSLITNLSLLGFFKYFNFGIESISSMLSLFGVDIGNEITILHIVLPLGISFYTFQSMSYSIDVYRGDAIAISNFGNFACYVSMFPQLVAGPIVRFSEIDDQLRNHVTSINRFSRGTVIFMLGFAKKILLANPAGKIADIVFSSDHIGFLDSWWGVQNYAFQIYFDFSGYSDMAIGLGLMLGFIFPKNFDSPYISRSITEFWRRWHLSLSNWLKDYLYIPLGGNRKGEIRTYINLSLVMLLGGLWHGASWNFIIWGLIHGVALAIERWIFSRKKINPYNLRTIRIIPTLIIVNIAWVFFRADNLNSAIKYLSVMIGLNNSFGSAFLIKGIIYKPYYILIFLISCFIVFKAPQTWNFTKVLNWRKVLFILIIFIFSISMMLAQSYNPFIYFIF